METNRKEKRLKEEDKDSRLKSRRKRKKTRESNGTPRCKMISWWERNEMDKKKKVVVESERRNIGTTKKSISKKAWETAN